MSTLDAPVIAGGPPTPSSMTPTSVWAALLRSGREAFVEAWQPAMWAGVVVMAQLLVFVLVRGPKQREAIA